MKKLRLVVVGMMVLGCAVGMWSTAWAVDLNPEHDITVAFWLGETIAEFTTAFNQGDEALFESYIHEGYVLKQIGQATVEGQAAVDVAFDLTDRDVHAVTQELDIHELILDVNLAIVRGDSFIHVTPVQGGDTVTWEFRFLQVWQLDDQGDWKLTHTITNMAELVG